MVWQDIVISLSNLLFTYSLINQVVYGFRKKGGFITFQTSLLTTIGLSALTVAFFTLNLIFSTIVSGTNAILWLTLLIQRVKYGMAK